MYYNSDIGAITYNAKTYFIKWYMNTWCNFHCPYCIQHDKSNAKDSQEVIESRAKNINQILINNGINKPLFLRLLGGECTIYNLINVLKQFTVKIDTVGITTNFSMPNSYFQELYLWGKENKIKLHLTLSYHKEHKTFFKKALEFTNWCRNNGFKDPEITLIITKDFDYNIIEKYKKLGLSRFKPILARGEGNVWLENTDLLKDWAIKLRQNNNVISDKGPYEIEIADKKIKCRNLSWLSNDIDYNGFIPDGRYCSAGVTGITIRPAGDIYRSACAMLNNKEYLIGYTNNVNTILPKDPILCKINSYQGYASRCNLCNHNNISKIVDQELFDKALSYETKINQNIINTE